MNVRLLYASARPRVATPHSPPKNASRSDAPFGRFHPTVLPMANAPGSITLIFREIDRNWRKEHALNLIAAFLTRSKFSHVEIAIGDEAGANHEMCNVVRIFNDDVGVEIAQRTGRSPSFQYVQLGCSRDTERRMLAFAMRQQGKPFSRTAMARSIVWPRTTDLKSFFCAELVAAVLQEGQFLPRSYNPGAATPESLYREFISQGTTTGNPCTLRSFSSAGSSTPRSGAAMVAPAIDANSIELHSLGLRGSHARVASTAHAVAPMRGPSTCADPYASTPPAAYKRAPPTSVGVAQTMAQRMGYAHDELQPLLYKQSFQTLAPPARAPRMPAYTSHGNAASTLVQRPVYSTHAASRAELAIRNAVKQAQVQSHRVPPRSKSAPIATRPHTPQSGYEFAPMPMRPFCG